MAKKGYLILEDGSLFEGAHLNSALGIGEVVFNTSHSGYEEMATDPSYFKQILVTTAPMQGNYGVSKDFWESDKIHISGFICLEMQNSKRDSSWLDLLSESGVPVLDQLDTRKLALHLRDLGSVWGGVFESSNVAEAKKAIQAEKEKYVSLDWTELVSVKEPVNFEGSVSSGHHLGLMDFGYKKNILRELLKRSSKVTVFPASTKATDILSSEVSGLMLSNGPGDPSLVKDPVLEIKELLGKLPIFGICMGHQLLGQALNISTFKLKFGHRGANHPIHDLNKDFVYVSSQNHGYALKSEDIKSGVKVTHMNLNDNTVAGISSVDQKCFSVQFHPESHPGPHEAQYLFDDFLNLVSNQGVNVNLNTNIVSKNDKSEVSRGV